MKFFRLIFSLFVGFGLVTTSHGAGNETPAVLKVCADPHHMPFSSENLDGFENRIAAVIADELGIAVEYKWFPQSMGFIRNTLRKRSETSPGYECDLVIGVPAEYELAITTEPYFKSTYALVVNQKGRLGEIQDINDILALPEGILSDVRIGLTERSPGALWLARHNLLTQIEPYIAQVGDPKLFSGQLIYEDLSAGKTDGAIVWGPVAGYFTKLDTNLRLIPMQSSPGLRLDYSISAGVRFRENEWRDQIGAILKSRESEIRQILLEYNIPLLAL